VIRGRRAGCDLRSIFPLSSLQPFFGFAIEARLSFPKHIIRWTDKSFAENDWWIACIELRSVTFAPIRNYRAFPRLTAVL
jgi:hypothetical protein